MKKIIKNPIFTFILGALIFGGIVGVSAYTIFANDIGYTPKDTTWKKANGEDITNVKDAIDDLYSKTYNSTYTTGINPVSSSTSDSRMIYSSNTAGEIGAFAAFDRNDNTFWTSDAGASSSFPQYLGWDFGEKVIVYSFSIKNRSDMIDKNVLDFVLQGYNSNQQWEDIQSYTNTNMQKAGISTYNVAHPKKYSKYRIYITSVSPSGTYVQINQLDFNYLK